MNELDRILSRALREDIGPGDITTDTIVSQETQGSGVFIGKQDLIVSGMEVAGRVFHLLDDTISMEVLINDGELAKTGQALARVKGSLKSLLTGERVALNFLMRMSGIASLTRSFVNAVKDYDTVIADTRKTAPGLRLTDRMAVRHGTGKNHRMGLYDAVLIKDNHIRVAGGVKEAVNRVRGRVPHTVKIEVEVTDLDELNEALESKADIIMLDNMELDEISAAVKVAKGRAIIEASGMVSLDSVEKLAERGVEVISVGRITHSAPAADISFEITEVG